LHNTVSPTIVNGGSKINVIPSQIELQLDGRLLPGYKPEDMVLELQRLLGAAASFWLFPWKMPCSLRAGFFTPGFRRQPRLFAGGSRTGTAAPCPFMTGFSSPRGRSLRSAPHGERGSSVCERHRR